MPDPPCRTTTEGGGLCSQPQVHHRCSHPALCSSSELSHHHHYLLGRGEEDSFSVLNKWPLCAHGSNFT